MTYAERTPLQIDHATGERICARCWADISHRATTARYCTHECRHRAKGRSAAWHCQTVIRGRIIPSVSPGRSTRPLPAACERLHLRLRRVE